MNVDAHNVRPAEAFRLDSIAKPQDARPRPSRSPRIGRGPSPEGGVFIVLFGVLLPSATLLVELFTRMCTTTFFNPLPTPLHVALVALVPIANGLAWWETRDMLRTPRHLTLLGVLNGIALAVSACYALMFLPMLPPAVFAVLFFGLGLLPMGPMFGFFAALTCRRRLVCREANFPGRRVPGLWPGFAAGALALVLPVVSSLTTQHGLKMASSDNPVQREEGVRFLRSWGSEDELLRSCYWQRRGQLNLARTFFGPALNEPETARDVFYRVTGTSADEHPSPLTSRAGWLDGEDVGDGDWDLRGGEVVGGVLPGLSVVSSRIDGSINADAATAYFEWTLEFKNDKSFPQEARCRIALPPDGVVSRLTLWINGEEREAAFGGRAKVREAYQQVVVVQRRDPVLVTQAGPDRVQVQCFPVPPGGIMKTRVGITAPLRLASLASGTVRLPCFADRNFALPASLAHTLWIESRSPLSASGVSDVSFVRVDGDREAHREGVGDVSVLKGWVTDAGLLTRTPIGVARRADAPVAVAFDDPYDPAVGTVVQRLEPFTAAPPARVVLAVDASASMAAALPAVADALAGLPPGVAVSAVVSRDGTKTIEGDAATVARKLREVQCVGGQDSVPALLRAWDLASGQANAVVLWVHGPQPMLLDSTEAIKQRVDRTGSGPRVLHLQAVPGSNEVLERLSEVVRVEAVPATGSVAQDLAAQFGAWSQSTQQWRFVRTAGPKPQDGEVAGGDIQIVRLWAYEQVLAMAARPGLGQSAQTEPATALAVRHHLVTPVSGAVVLETQQQYDAAGLAPVTAIPLPPAVWMMLVMAPVVWWVTRKSRMFATR